MNGSRKSLRIILVLFAILGLLGSDLCAMKRQSGAARDSKKELKARKQEERKLSVYDSDDGMDAREDQDDDAEVQELARRMEQVAKISDEQAQIWQEGLAKEIGGEWARGLSLQEFKVAFVNMMASFVQ